MTYVSLFGKYIFICNCCIRSEFTYVCKSLLKKVKDKSEKAGLKLNFQ